MGLQIVAQRASDSNGRGDLLPGEGWGWKARRRSLRNAQAASLDGGCPFLAGGDNAAYIEAPVEVPAARKVRDAAASFDDHFGQPRLFWLRMSPTEREHIVAAYTFELGKCYENAVKERALTVLANIDGELCRTVAQGLGLPAPEPRITLTEPDPSPALSQLRGRWPADGRVIGLVVADPDQDVAEVRRAVLAADMVPLVIAPSGGPGVQRTFSGARSIEFDALLLAGAPGPAADAYTVRDAKTGAGGPGDTDIDSRVVLLVSEAYRHGKPLGSFGDGASVLEAAGLGGSHPGVIRRDTGRDTLEQVVDLLGEHRVWQSFPPPLG